MGTLSGTGTNIRQKKYGPGVRHFIWSILLALLLATGSVCHAQDVEQQIKAAFLYHFCAYVQWPESLAPDDRPIITIGVSGTREATRLIRNTLEGKSRGKCAFQIRSIKPGDDLSNVRMLYIARKSRFSLDDFLSLRQPPPILTITDEEKASSESMINFVIHEDNVRFVISKSRADQAGLKLSSELLAVALQVN